MWDYNLVALQQVLRFFSFCPTAMTIFLPFTKRIHQSTYTTASFEDISFIPLKMFEILGGGKRSFRSTTGWSVVAEAPCAVLTEKCFSFSSSFPVVSDWKTAANHVQGWRWNQCKSAPSLQTIQKLRLSLQSNKQDGEALPMNHQRNHTLWAHTIHDHQSKTHECWAQGIWLWDSFLQHC